MQPANRWTRMSRNCPMARSSQANVSQPTSRAYDGPEWAFASALAQRAPGAASRPVWIRHERVQLVQMVG